MKIWTFITTMLVSMYTFMFGDSEKMKQYLVVLLVLWVIDIITGIVFAIQEGKLRSKTFWIGFTKKLLYFLMISAIYHIEKAGLIGTDGKMAIAGCIGYIAYEFMSIIENWGNIGLPLPNVIKDILGVLNNKED